MSEPKFRPDAATFLVIFVVAIIAAGLLTDVSGLSDWLVARSCGARPPRSFSDGGAEIYWAYLECVRNASWQSSIVAGAISGLVILILGLAWKREAATGSQ